MPSTVGTKSPPAIYQFDTSPNDVKFRQEKECKGKIKLELWYETAEATHIASRIMQSSSAYEGPFIESICILVDPDKTYDMIEAYWDFFEALRDVRLVPLDATLQGFDVLMEDCLIQAWVIE